MIKKPKIEIKETIWNLKTLFLNDEDPKINEELEIVRKESYKFINKWKDRKDYLADPKILLDALNEYEYWERYHGTGGKQSYYFGLRLAQEQSNSKLKAIENKLNDFEVSIENDIQFFLLRISKIPQSKQSRFLLYEPLKKYKHFLERLFEFQKHVLSENEEKIMNFKQKTSYANWVRMLSEFLSKEEGDILTESGKQETKNFSELLSLTSSKNIKIRKSAAEALEKIFLKNIDVSEAEFNSILEDKKINDTIRGFSRPDQQRHMVDDIDSEIVDVITNTVSESFNISREYYSFKAKMLGLEKLNYYERSVEYGDLDIKFHYKDAINLVYETFLDLDAEFADILKMYVSENRIDVFPRKGKSGGAFCSHFGIDDPTFILLNHDNKINDVLTIAHEIGHGINNELIKSKQNALNFGTPVSTAEVASTFMEDFVLQRLAEGLDDKHRLIILMMKLDSDISKIFRQTAFYNFEKEIHKSFREIGFLDKHLIGNIYKKHMESYMGEAAKGSENWWIYVDHFRYYFYVYSYVSGLLISKSLQRLVKDDKTNVNKVKEFLSVGLSKPPKEIFLNMHINISDPRFWSDGIDEVKDLFIQAKDLAFTIGKLSK